jgi:predicted ATPase
VLGHDGADLAAALQTIREIGDARALDAAVDLAFRGSRVSVTRDESGRFDLRLSQPGLQRPLSVAELSDGTLRYLLWVAALLTPRPPELPVLNEPETSLHPDLLAPLARLIVTAARSRLLEYATSSRRVVSRNEGRAQRRRRAAERPRYEGACRSPEPPSPAGALPVGSAAIEGLGLSRDGRAG